MLMQAVKKGLVAGLHCSRLVQHDHIDALKRFTMVSKGFPDDAFQAIATDCKPAVLFGHGQTEPCFLLAVFFVKNRKHFVAAAFCFFEDAAVGGRIKKPGAPAEAAIRRLAWYWNFFRWIRDRRLSVLRREQRSSFRTAPFQHEAACLCCHPGSKTMRACPLQIAGLECAFHVADT